MLILLVLLFGKHSNAYGQKSYDALLQEGKEWTMLYESSISPYYIMPDIFEKYKLSGDTVIESILFKKEYRKSWQRDLENEPMEWGDSKEYVGESGGKVFLWWEGTDSPLCVMDFTLNVGETIQGMFEYEEYIVKTVSDTIISLSADRKSRRYLYLSDVREISWGDIWIEGIGSVNYGLSGILGFTRSGSRPQLIRCEDNGVCTYRADVSTDEIKPQTLVKCSDLFDLQGRRLQTPPRKGVYISGGKKFVR